MKNTLKITAIALFSLLFTGGGTGVSTAKATPDMGFEVGVDFYSSNLSNYGEWVNVSYGQAWRPYNVSRGWRPYLNGRWMWTDDGWYWSSYEPYGWATYHYGRWTYDDYYGWIWIPGNVWAPAWVEWRYNDDYIGWAPLCPDAEFGFSFGIRYRHDWYAPVHYWNFVPCRNFTAYRVNEYVAPVERSRRFFGSTRGVNRIEGSGDRVINRGVDRNFIERRGNVRIERSEMVSADRDRGERVIRGEGGRERIEVYRPRIDDRSSQRTPEVNGQRNNSDGRSYNEMHGGVRQIPDQRQSDQRQTEQRQIEQRQVEQRRADQNRVEPRGQGRQDEGRRSVETPERWRQRMPEQRSAPSVRNEPRVQNRGGFNQPQRQAAPATRSAAPEGRRGGGRRP